MASTRPAPASRAKAHDGATRRRARLPAAALVITLVAGLTAAAALHGPALLTIRRESRALDDVLASFRSTESPAGAAVERCVAELRRLLRRYPASPDTFAALARFHGRFGRADECIRCWRRCLELDPRSAAMAWQAIGAVALAEGRFPDAVEAYRAAHAAEPGAFEPRIGLAEALLGEGAAEESLRVLDDTVAAHGRSLPALALTGQACLQLRRYAEARTAFTGAIELGPDYPAAHHGLAMAATRLGDDAAASRARESFQSLQHDKERRHRSSLATGDDRRDLGAACARTLVDAARVCFAHGDADGGERLLLEAREGSPEEPSCRLLLARIHESRGLRGKALAAFRDAAGVGHDDASHLLAVADGLARLGAIDDAEAVHRRIIDRAPHRPAGHAALAQLLVRAGRDPAEAERLARRAAELAPTAAYWALVAEACERGDRLAEAVTAASRAVELEPHDATWSRLLARLRLRSR